MFEVKGLEPQWQTIYGRISEMKIGDEIKDDELFGLLPDAPEASVRGAFYRAVQQVEDENSRTFARVRNVGYRMVEAAQHEHLARRQHRFAKRRLKSAARKLHSADRSLLTPDERRRFDALEDHVSRQQEMLRRLEARQDKTETELQTIRRTHKQDIAAVAEEAKEAAREATVELLRRHGIYDEASETATAA